MRKKVLSLTMVLLGLFAGVNTMWAINISGMTPEEAETMGFWARLTAKPAATTNGSGKVYVVSQDNYWGDPADGDYKSESSDDGFSDIFLASSLINADVAFRIYAKADAGSYFKGWSFTDGYTDLGTESSDFKVEITPSSSKAHANVREYPIYAAFEKVKLVSYEISGDPNTYDDGNGNFVCEQTVTFRAETPGFSALSSGDDVRHFKLPTITRKDGTTGTWSTSITEWDTYYISLNGEYAEINVPVTFTAPDGNVAEYGAELVLETYAGVKMKVYLSARTTGGDYEAVRYNKSKVQQEMGNLSTLLSNAAAGDIVKLNKDYASPVSINKNITFDLNGFELSSSLTVSGGNVTLAYSPYGGTISDDIAVTGGKLALNGGTISGEVTVNAGSTLEQNGAIISGNVNNNGTLTTTDGKCLGYVYSAGTLNVNGGYFKNEMDFDQPAITVTGGTASINRGDIGGTDDDQCYYGIKATGGAVTVTKLASVRGEAYALWNAGGSITVNGGKFFKPEVLAEEGTITFNAGYFKHKDNEEQTSVLGKQIWRNTAGPEAREGYDYFVGDQASAQAANVSVCRIGHASYSSLEDALAYANNHTSEEVIIIMENDYSLKAGYYTLPANATLIVPMSNEQETANQIIPRSTSGAPTPVSFRKLILENGVNLDVTGTIELTCTQHGTGATMGIPGGNYGHLIMKPGSHMTINNGGELRAWGFVTGDGTKDAEGNYLSGEIDARRGAVVREMFQMGDWKGGDVSLSMVMPMEPFSQYHEMSHLFPVYTYFIQNVESPVKYHPGASLICATSVNVAGSINAYANDIKVVGKEGEPAMFLMDEMADAENTWVRKYYDAKNDKQVYEVNSGAQLGSVVINLGDVPVGMVKPGMPGSMKIELDSRKFVLPLTNNFKIHLLSGYMEFTQSTSCLPGMEVEVDKESEVAIIKNDDPSIVSGALYFYDADQWGKYVYNKKYGAIVQYSATWDLGTAGATTRPDVRNINSPAAIGDAILNVHGTFRMGENCAVYTTAGKSASGDPSNMTYTTDMSSGGGSIISRNEDAGTFIFEADAMAASDLVMVDGTPEAGQLPASVLANYDNTNGMEISTVLGSTAHVYGFELCTSARLRNGDGTFANTYTDEDDHARTNDAYCYINDRWTIMKVAEENDCFMKDNYGTFYAKPAEYVAVSASVDGEGNVVGNADHTYSDKAGAGRLFILMSDCQWWEVEKKDNLYHCIHPQNDTYYYWDEGEEKWMEQRFTITWLNWDGKVIKSYTYDPVTGDPEEVEYRVTYGTMAEYLGSNPTREADDDYTYNFIGWSPALDKVTSDVTYTATYEKQQRKYTIIFTEEGGTEIERQFLTHNEMPSCENTPKRTGFTLEWEPAIAAVTGDATYRATWLPEPPKEYQITFFDHDGTTVLQQGLVAVDATPVAPSTPSGKPATSEFTYVFDHWSPAIEPVSVDGPKSYIAVYKEVAKKYTVTFRNEDNSVIESNEYAYGETPVCSATPTKENTAEFTYSFAWTPQIQTVMGNAEYKAVFTPKANKYTVTLRSTPLGTCTLTGTGTYDYNTPVSISATPATGYHFVRWADGITANPRNITVTADVTYEAVLEAGETPETFTVTLTSSIAGACTLTGAGTYDENTVVTIEAVQAEGYHFVRWSDDNTDNPRNITITEDVTLTAVMEANAPETFTVTLTSSIAGACTLTGAGTYDENTVVTIEAVQAEGYHFVRWSDDNTVNPRDITVKEDITLEAVMEADAPSVVVVEDGDTENLNDITETNIVVEKGGDLNVSSSDTRSGVITLVTDGSQSGQIHNAGNIGSNWRIVLEYILNPAGTIASPDLWYAISVPFQVDIENGITRASGSTSHVSGSDFVIMEYDENMRATTGKGWKKKLSGTLEPGTLYMMGIAGDCNKWLFEKKAGADVQGEQTKDLEFTAGATEANKGWNGMGNTRLEKMYIGSNLGIIYIVVYNNLINDYTSLAIADMDKVCVGQAFFVQATAAAGNMTFTSTKPASMPALRAGREADPMMRFTLADEQNGLYIDHMYVTMHDDAAKAYTIGRDVARMDGGNKHIQKFWCYNAEGMKLAAHDIAYPDAQTIVNLGIYAPADGEYTLNMNADDMQDYDVELLWQGSSIATLSDEKPVTLSLKAGTTEDYKVRIARKMPTGIEEVPSATNDLQATKVLIDGRMYIIRAEHTYDAQGKMVK